jgi:hypothetical protein
MTRLVCPYVEPVRATPFPRPCAPRLCHDPRLIWCPTPLCFDPQVDGLGPGAAEPAAVAQGHGGEALPHATPARCLLAREALQAPVLGTALRTTGEGEEGGRGYAGGRGWHKNDSDYEEEEDGDGDDSDDKDTDDDDDAQGTAKTSIVTSIAYYLGWNFVTIDTADFLAYGLQNIASRMTYIFDRLKMLEKTVILFDEIEEFCLDREDRPVTQPGDGAMGI